MSDIQRTMLESGRWQLRLFGEFSLRRPDGSFERLPDRKVAGLLAILLIKREYGIERSAAAEILWPGRAPSNLTNLRQALSALRRALGAEAIETSSNHCRLTSAIIISSDYETSSERRGGFMPGLAGDWFDEIRSELSFSDEPPGSDEVVASFQHALKWFAVHDRRGLHSLLQARPSMSRGITYENLLSLLAMGTEDTTCAGWSLYWRGTAEESLQKCARLLTASFQDAQQSQNSMLASEACLELGKVHSRSGKLPEALKICEIADDVAKSTNSRTARSNAMRLRGTVQVHWQDPMEGLTLLRQMEDLLDDPIEISIARSARAFYEASARCYEAATETLDQAQALSRKLKHHRIDITSSLTEVLLMVGRGAKSEAAEALVPLVPHYYAIGSTQFGVYAQEMLASLLTGFGEKDTAREHMLSARGARRKSQMAMTRLEAQRIGKMV